jgi:transposase
MMEITESQYQQIEDCLPRQRGNVRLPNLQVLNAILYDAEQGCKWRGLPRRFGRWHTVYTRKNRGATAGVLERVIENLQRSQIIRLKIEAVSLDSASIKVHPDGTGALKKNGGQSVGKSRGGWNAKIHLVAADDRTVVAFSLSPGEAHDAPEGRQLLNQIGPVGGLVHLLMDRACEGDETRQLARDPGYSPVVPPKRNRINAWEYDQVLCRRRNEVERLFRRLKGFRRIFSRIEKLDRMFCAFIHFVLIIDALR